MLKFILYHGPPKSLVLSISPPLEIGGEGRTPVTSMYRESKQIPALAICKKYMSHSVHGTLLSQKVGSLFHHWSLRIMVGIITLFRTQIFQSCSLLQCYLYILFSLFYSLYSASAHLSLSMCQWNSDLNTKLMK